MTALLLALAGAALAGSTGASGGAETGTCKATQGNGRGVPPEWQLQVELPPGTSAISAAGAGGEVVLVSKAGEVPCGVTADAIRGGTVTGTASDDNVIFDNSSGGGPLQGAFEVDLRAGNDGLTAIATKGDDTAIAHGPPPGGPSTASTFEISHPEEDLNLDMSSDAESVQLLFLGGLDLFGFRAPRSDSAGPIAVPVTLSGGGGADRLTGGSADDTIRGGGGGDRLAGGAGEDLLDGGGGEDRCRGGPGKDREKRCE